MKRKGQLPYTLPDDEIVAAYLAGDSLRAIAERINVSHELVRTHLQAAGVQLREKAPRKYFPIPCKTCGEMFTPGYAGAQFCSRPHISPQGRHKQAFCKRGHPLIPENMYPSYSGGSPARCKTCAQDRQREYNRKKKGL
jgi:hypothetical protein